MSPLPLQLVHVDPTDPPANGDIPVYSSASQLYVPTAGINGNVTASGTLTSNQVVIGQGTKAVAALGSLGTTTTVLHGNAAGAPSFATVVEADITLADNTTNNCSTSAHGFLKKLDNLSTSFMNGQGNWATPAGAGNVSTGVTLTSGQLVVGAGTTNIGVGNLSGDVTTAGGTAATLANSGITAGSYGSQFTTFDAKGRATATVSNYLQYREQQTQNTTSGTFSSGAWRTRVLNTEVSDDGGFGSLSSNQITLAAGTYIISALAPAFAVNRHQLRLQNVTDTATVLVGQSSHSVAATASVSSSASLRGVFTIAASKALELQHQCETSASTRGFGIESNFTTEVYAIVELWRVG
jgi:hypothetical protein